MALPDLDFVLRFLNITLMDLALSGDNAIVIGMAAASLPPDKRRFAIMLGGLLAIALRIGLTTIATLLMLVPYLSAVGGIVLVWVVWKLLKLDAGPEVVNEAEKESASTFRQAIVLILAADFMMSVDNVIAIAGSAHGSVPLLIAGLLISMPLLMLTGGVISSLIDKARWLVYVGAIAISFTAARMVFEDKAIELRFPLPGPVPLVISAALAFLLPLACVGIQKGLAMRRLRIAEKVEANYDHNFPTR
jgi:YjbE family integral membrane protein